MSQKCSEKMDFHWKLIFYVKGDYYCIWRPADDKHNEDAEECEGRFDGLVQGLLASFWVVFLKHEQIPLRFPDPLEYQHVAYTHDEKWSSDETCSNKEGVRITGRSVPDALVVLGVKIVTSPSQEVWKFKQGGSDPTQDAHDGAGGLVIELVIDLVMTEVDVPVDGEHGEADEGAETCGETHAGHYLTQEELVVKEHLPLHHA